jgi:hypothetical protein
MSELPADVLEACRRGEAAAFRALVERYQIKDCYEHALESNPKLAGRVTVEMKIRARDGKGKVDEAEILYDESNTDDLDSPGTEHCLLGAIAGTDFPAPRGDGEVIVRYPFVLKAAEAD